MISLGKKVKGLIYRNRGSYSCDFFSKKKGPRIEADGLIFLISLVKKGLHIEIDGLILVICLFTKRGSSRNRRSYGTDLQCMSLVQKGGAHTEIDGLMEKTFSVSGMQVRG